MEPVAPGVNNPSTDTPPPAPAVAKAPLKERIKTLLEDYGPGAFTV